MAGLLGSVIVPARQRSALPSLLRHHVPALIGPRVWHVGVCQVQVVQPMGLQVVPSAHLLDPEAIAARGREQIQRCELSVCLGLANTQEIQSSSSLTSSASR